MAAVAFATSALAHPASDEVRRSGEPDAAGGVLAQRRRLVDAALASGIELQIAGVVFRWGQVGTTVRTPRGFLQLEEARLLCRVQAEGVYVDADRAWLDQALASLSAGAVARIAVACQPMLRSKLTAATNVVLPLVRRQRR